MSPSLVEDINTSLSNGVISKRSSTEKTSLDRLSRRSVDGLSAKGPDSYAAKNTNHENGHINHSNGVATENGIIGSIKHAVAGLTNGTHHDVDDASDKERERESKSTTLTNLSRPSTVVDLERSECDRRPQKLANRDDGFFAENPRSEREATLFSDAHVSLDASQLDGAFLSTANNDPLENSIATAQTLHDNTASIELDRSENTSLKSPHRISSPPALQVSSSTNLNAPQPGKLQQRHTLEVPRVSTSRTSRETDRTTNDVYASGRFSPVPNTPTRRRPSVSLVRRVTRSAHSDLHLDEPPQSEEAERWAEMIRAKRASKRRRRDDDDDDRVVMGTKVDQNHVNYITAYNMLTGIRFTVSRTNAKLDRDLLEADFDAKHKFSFDITGNELTPSAKYDFKFKDYAPWVFRHLRKIFRIDPADYLMSLTSKYILSELGSPGKSGSFFYFSRDYKYIIKTIHHAEHKVLRKILREYYNHVKDNPNTLLSQFYGLHRVKVPYGRKIHFVVMNNLFPPHRDIHRTFDLKGSTIGRDFREEDLDKNPRATLKDLNWMRRNMHLELGPVKKQRFIEQMHKDVALLQKLKIMDYSMLIGIHDLSKGNEDKLRDKTLKVFQPGGDKGEEPIAPQTTLMRTPSKLETQRKANELRVSLMQERPVPMGQTVEKMPEDMPEDQKTDFYFYSDDKGFRATHEDDTPGEQVYYLGIIDCLTHYGLIKRLEHFWKGINSTETQISAIPPDRYGDRFINFIGGITKSKELADKTSTEQPPIDPLTRRSSSMRTGPSSPTSATDHKHTQTLTSPSGEKLKHVLPEPSIPDRSLKTVHSPATDPDEPYTLPVVEEAGENGSVGGRSHGSGSHSPARRSTASTEPKMPERPPPPTPPEMEKAELDRRLLNGNSQTGTHSKAIET